MKSLIIKQLRERSCVKRKQKTWVSECSDDQLYQLFQKLRNGESAKSIAQYIQKAWKINEQSTAHSISQGIQKFKKRIEDLLQVEIPSEVLPDCSLEQPDEEDNLLALDRVVRLQRQRIERMMNEETEKGVTFHHLSRDLQSLATLAKVLVKEKDFALHHLSEDPVKKRREELRARRAGENFQGFIDNLTEDARERIVQVAERFLEGIAQDAVPMIQVEDENGKKHWVSIEGSDYNT